MTNTEEPTKSYDTAKQMNNAATDLKPSDIDTIGLECTPPYIMVNLDGVYKKMYVNEFMFEQIEKANTPREGIFETVAFELTREHPFLYDDIATDLYRRLERTDIPQPFNLLFITSDADELFQENEDVMFKIIEEEQAKYPDVEPRIVENIVFDMMYRMKETLFDKWYGCDEQGDAAATEPQNDEEARKTSP